MFHIFFLLFCRVQSTSISEADVCGVRLKERNWEGGLQFQVLKLLFPCAMISEYDGHCRVN